MPKKEKNALKHGVFAKEAIEDRKHVQALIGETRKLLGISNDVRPSLPRDCWQNWRFVSVSAEPGASPAPGQPPFLEFAVTHTLW